MTCDDIRKAMADFAACEQTPEGARIATHCLYPSFEHVRVFVAKVGEGFAIHDGAGAHNAAWLHGRDADLIGKSISEAADRFHIQVSGKAIVARVKTIDWLASGILSVANASSMAAHDAVDKITAAQEEALIDRIGKTLGEFISQKDVTKNVDIIGTSGGRRHFDYILRRESPLPVYINSVTPRRNSVSAKYVSFADNPADRRFKLAVHDRELEVGDVALLAQVADVVPLASLIAGFRRKKPVNASANTSGACGLSTKVIFGCSAMFVMTPSLSKDIWRSDDGGRTWKPIPLSVSAKQEISLPVDVSPLI